MTEVTMEYTDILYDIQDGVARITINRPHRMNSFTPHTLDELTHAVQRSEVDKDVGVVVLTGAGEKAFCAGGDVREEEKGSLVRGEYNFHTVLGQCLKPVIARVNGYAIGGGNHMAYFCDLTVAAEHATFGQNGPRVAAPASGHVVSYLARQIGHKRAREVWMTCRRYTAKQMLEWGLVNSVVPLEKLDEEVRKYCEDILACSPTCLKIIKASFEAEFDMIRGQRYQYVKMIAPGFAESPEQKEGARAFLEKRKPDFSSFR
jgi:dihydroxynaphthoic acid synthetase